jgi:Tfp pilus assembly protein PilO
MADLKTNEAATKKRQDTYRQLAVWLPAITVILFLGYAAAAWFLLFVPKISQLLPGGSLDNSAIEDRIATDQAYVNRVDAALKDFTVIPPAELDKIERMLPKDIAFPSLLGQLESIAVENDMLLTSLQTSPGTASSSLGGAVPVTVNVNFAGGSGYQSFLNLLQSLEQSQRIFDLHQFQYSPDLTGYSFRMTTYYLP